MIEAPIPRLVDDLIRRLEGPETAASLARDPYWPKWDSPWWHMALLVEMGEAARIPAAAIAALTRAIAAHYLPTFVLVPEDLPPGKEGRHVLCHCAYATAYRVVAATTGDPDRHLPAARAWFLRYGLRDGGWNCDEEANLKEAPASSVVSTAAVLEAMLAMPAPWSPEEAAAMDAAAAYLLAKRFFRAERDGRVLDARWLHPAFPRFYEYDVLRGTLAVTAWARARGKQLPPGALDEVMATLAPWAAAGCAPRPGELSRGTYVPPPADSPEGEEWPFERPPLRFPLLDAVRATAPNPWLRRDWDALRAAATTLGWSP